MKAFDRVNHSTLLSKLTLCGLKGTAYQFLFYTNNIPRVRGFLCRSCASTFRILNWTILGPLLFFPHIDLPMIVCQFSEPRRYVRMYADDTHLSYTVYLHISVPFMLLKIEICPICTTAKKLILNTT